MKKFLPENKTIMSLFYIATLVIVVNFIFWNDTTSYSGEKGFDKSLNVGELSAIIDKATSSVWEIDFERAENSLTFVSTQITKINQSSYNFWKTLTSDFFLEPIYHIFTSINAP